MGETLKQGLETLIFTLKESRIIAETGYGVTSHGVDFTSFIVSTYQGSTDLPSALPRFVVFGSRTSLKSKFQGSVRPLGLIG